MRFVSNPYNFGTTDDERESMQIQVDLECFSFEYRDDTDENAKPQIAIHYYMSNQP